MNYLVDTHIVLWLAENSPKLTEKVKSIILDETVMKYVSVASCWEIAIKLSLNKLELDGGTKEFFRIVNENGFQLLDIEESQLTVLESLPFRHKDPFDRLLTAAAISEDLTLLTSDSNIQAYKEDGLSMIS